MLFDDYASAYPYAADGRIPVSGEAGFLYPFGTAPGDLPSFTDHAAT